MARMFKKFVFPVDKNHSAQNQALILSTVFMLTVFFCHDTKNQAAIPQKQNVFRVGIGIFLLLSKMPVF
jgi:hypothetical protein